MRERDQWKPSWCRLRGGVLVVSKNTQELHVSSRLVAGLGLAEWQRWIAAYARGRLLDLGCGKVPFYEVYEPYVEDTVCVDWGNSSHGNQHADILCDLNDELPLPADAFDSVILSSVLEHIPSPEALVGEIARVLRPGGHLLLTVPFLYWIHEAPHDYLRFTEFALRHYCETHGLEVVEFAILGGAPEVLFDISSKVVARIPLIGSPTAASLQWIATWMVRQWPLAAVSRRTSASFPAGYMLVARRA